MSPAALFDLRGRVALVSGAASGMGRAMSIALAEAGADLMLAGRHLAGLERTAGEIEKLSRRAVPVTCDVSQPDQIRRMFAHLDRDFGRIDFLGNVAGEAVLGAPEDIPLEAVERVNLNVLLSSEAVAQSVGAAQQVRVGVLPNVSASAQQRRTQSVSIVNGSAVEGSPAGRFDGKLAGNYSLLNPTQLSALKSSRLGVDVAEADLKATTQLAQATADKARGVGLVAQIVQGRRDCRTGLCRTVAEVAQGRDRLGRGVALRRRPAHLA